MIAKDSFIILQSGTELTGALCRVGLKSRDVSYLHHVTCADLTPQAVASGLRSLLDGLAAAGLKRPDDVRVCLSAGAALFRDWAFPFRSRAKVEQALSLMLETEFPFDADTLSHRVCLTGNAAASAGYKSGVQAISVSLRKEERDSWLDAFEAEGLFPRLVTVDPFPLLMNLPSRQNGMALLLYVQRGCSTLALLDNGVIRRIRTIPVGWTPEKDAADLNVSLSERENAALRGFADRLRRETSLVLDGTPFVPDRLLAYGEAFLGNGASARFAEAFELPVSVLGQEVPLAGQVARLGETDPSRLLALCVGLPITQEQVDEMAAHLTDIDYDVARQREKEVRHDVMAHVYTFGKAAPKAAGIIHLGATSAYVGDNTDIIQIREGLLLVRKKLATVLDKLAQFADAHKSQPTLGFTHFQPAQLTTVGKRATLWMNELLMDLNEVEYRIENLRMLGSKGTTGTQASFMELFDGDESKVKELEKRIADDFGFAGVVPVSGQTYSRKIDAQTLATLAGIAESASKFATDLRLLQHLKEVEEPFEKNQIGSSAMPYKRNPMRSERICALARYVICDSLNPAFTSATQWFERTLDDSANKRISVPEAFLAVDAILNIMINVVSGLVVYPKVIEAHVMNELPFMATENIMMDAVKRGGNRQDLHERIREHSMAAGKRIKEEGLENDMVDRIAGDPMFGMTREQILEHLDPSAYIGRCPSQVDEFLSECVRPVIAPYLTGEDVKVEINL